jgi:hypothetical protein
MARPPALVAQYRYEHYDPVRRAADRVGRVSPLVRDLRALGVLGRRSRQASRQAGADLADQRGGSAGRGSGDRFCWARESSRTGRVRGQRLNVDWPITRHDHVDSARLGEERAADVGQVFEHGRSRSDSSARQVGLSERATVPRRPYQSAMSAW